MLSKYIEEAFAVCAIPPEAASPALTEIFGVGLGAVPADNATPARTRVTPVSGGAVPPAPATPALTLMLGLGCGAVPALVAVVGLTRVTFASGGAVPPAPATPAFTDIATEADEAPAEVATPAFTLTVTDGVGADPREVLTPEFTKVALEVLAVAAGLLPAEVARPALTLTFALPDGLLLGEVAVVALTDSRICASRALPTEAAAFGVTLAALEVETTALGLVPVLAATPALTNTLVVGVCADPADMAVVAFG